MTKKQYPKIVVPLCLLFLSETTYCNMIWPAIFVSEALFTSLFLVLISIIIEASCFSWSIENISFARALFMSCIGNAASALLGTIIMTFAILIWHLAFDTLLGGTFSTYNAIATYILMYLGSSLIELLAIKIFFRYSFKELWIPILIGNLTTYALTLAFNFEKLQVIKVLKSLGIA